MGRKRIKAAVEFTGDGKDGLAGVLEEERTGWNLFYDILDSFEHSISQKKGEYERIKTAALETVENCRIKRDTAD